MWLNTDSKEMNTTGQENQTTKMQFIENNRLYFDENCTKYSLKYALQMRSDTDTAFCDMHDASTAFCGMHDASTAAFCGMHDASTAFCDMHVTKSDIM